MNPKVRLLFICLVPPLFILASQTALGGPKPSIVEFWSGNMVLAYATPYAIYYSVILSLAYLVYRATRPAKGKK